MDETRKPVLDKSKVVCESTVNFVDPSLLPIASSRDKGDDTRVGYDIDTTFGGPIVFDVCRLRLSEGVVRMNLRFITIECLLAEYR